MHRFLTLTLTALIWSGCAEPPAPAPKPDPTLEAHYGESVRILAELNQQARSALAAQKRDEASDLVQRGAEHASKVLAVPSPTLAAMEAVSDRDQLYAEMLMANRHWSYARQLLVKNQVRWKNWTPRTEDSERRLRQAEAAIAECDKRLLEP